MRFLLPQCNVHSMIRTTEQAIAKLRELSFPAVFEQIQLGTGRFFIKTYCGAPKNFFVAAGNSSIAGIETWLPLWEFNGEELNAFDMKSNLFIRYDYLSPGETIIGRNYQQFICNFFLELVNAGVVDDLKEFSTLFGFKHHDELLKLLERIEGDDWEKPFEDFVNSISE